MLTTSIIGLTRIAIVIYRTGAQCRSRVSPAKPVTVPTQHHPTRESARPSFQVEVKHSWHYHQDERVGGPSTPGVLIRSDDAEWRSRVLLGRFYRLDRSHLDRSRWVQIIRGLLPVAAAAAIGIAGRVHGVAAWIWLGIGVVVLAIMALVDLVRESYRSRLRQRQEEDAAAQIVALRDALSPIAESIADMHSLAEPARRERANGIAQPSADALALVMQGIPGFRSVVYRQDDAMNALEVLARAGRSEREPQRFTRGDDRGNAAFATVERREACFVRDVNDDDEWPDLRALTRERGLATGRLSLRR